MRISFPRRTLYSVLVLFLWLGFVVDGSHALFVSQASLTGGGMTTGTANLLVSNSQNASSSIFETTRPGFSFTMVPGESVEKYFFLKNSSSGLVDFDISMAVSGLTGTSDLAGSLMIGIYPTDENGKAVESGYSTLASELATPKETGLLVPHGETRRFILRTTLASGYSGQNISISYDIGFTGTQHTSL